MALFKQLDSVRQMALDEATHKQGDGLKAIALAIVYLADKKG